MRVLEIGDHYVSDFIKDESEPRKKYSLDLHLDNKLGAVRLHGLSMRLTMGTD